jgi:membrane protein DedA with SNARE-associated domain
MFDDPVSWTIEHGYPVLFGMLLFSGLGIPIPEDVPLIAAGVLARHGGMSVLEASVACSVFVLCRDLAVYGLGYRFGETLLENRWGRKLVREKDLRRVEGKVRDNGAAVVFIGRFLPGLRAAVFFAAGKAKIPPAKFLAVDALAAVVSIPAFIVAGYLCAANIEALMQVLREFRGLLICAAILGSALFLLRLHRRSDAAEQEVETRE